MKTKFNIYKLKETDTLISIAKELNKTKQEVAHFHNIFANDDNLIGVVFPKYLKELYVPVTDNIKELEHIPKVKFDYDSYLGLKYINETLTYQVENQITTKGRKYTLRNRTEVKFIKKSNDSFIIQINKIDKEKDSKLDSILYNLLEKLEEVFYPLQLIVSKEGQILKINNHKEIVGNWKKIKTTILQEYEGEIIENYISHYEKNIASEKTLKKFLLKDLFLKTYFNHLYGNYAPNFQINKQYSFPIISKIKDVDYKIQQKIDPFLTQEGKIEIQIMGKSFDKRTQLDYETYLDEPFFTANNVNPIVEGNFEAKYILNGVTYIIEKANLKCDLQTIDYENITVLINLVD